MIQLKSIHKEFKGLTVLSDINITIASPGIYLLYGGNGSGKSTLLKIFMGWQMPDTGAVLFDQHAITKWAVSKRVGLCGLSYLPQECGLLRGKTGRQNLAEARKYLGGNAATYSVDLYERLNITQALDKKIENLSKGELRKIEFAITFEQDAKFYFLDEPLTGWDRDSRKLGLNFLAKAAQKGKTIIICDHEYKDIAELCTGFIIIKNTKATQERTARTFLQRL